MLHERQARVLMKRIKGLCALFLYTKEDFMTSKKIKASLLDEKQIQKTLVRLAHEIIEKNPNLENLAIIGIRTRGDVIAKRIHSIIKDISKVNIEIGTLDVTFYRDDFKTNLGSPKVGPSNILFNVDKKNIILIDDVLYTGRTIRAAMDEIFSLGRPNRIQLGVLIDRGHRELPIKPNYIGKNYPTSFNEHIHVYLNETDNTEGVELMEYDE